jgi:hypothetical protein
MVIRTSSPTPAEPIDGIALTGQLTFETSRLIPFSLSLAVESSEIHIGVMIISYFKKIVP